MAPPTVTVQAPVGIYPGTYYGADGIAYPIGGTGQITIPTSILVAALNAGFSVISAPAMTITPGLIAESSSAALTAHAGGGQANATPLPNEINIVGTVATAGDSVVLPSIAALPAGQGLTIMVVNAGVNPMQVYGLGADTVDGVAAATGVTQMPSSVVFYIAAAAGAWKTEGLASGFSGGFSTMSFAGGLVAHAGGTQAAALPITTMVSRVVTVGTAGDSVGLPATVANISIGPLTITNAAAANAMNVFPALGDQINALGANTAFSLAAGKTATFWSTGAGQWHAVLSA